MNPLTEFSDAFTAEYEKCGVRPSIALLTEPYYEAFVEAERNVSMVPCKTTSFEVFGVRIYKTCSADKIVFGHKPE